MARISIAVAADGVKLAKAEYLEAKAKLDAANAASEECWGMYTEAEIDGWDAATFSEVAETIERNCETIPAGQAEKVAARTLVLACQSYVMSHAKTRRQYAQNAATFATLYKNWERLLSIRQRMIAACLDLNVDLP